MNKDGKGKDDDEEDTTKEETLAEDEGTEVQYLIKWLGYSHLHNTWETGRIPYNRLFLRGKVSTNWPYPTFSIKFYESQEH